jgi:orotidine-5'-phosphate decarboxylase
LSNPKLLIALDFDSREACRALVDQLDPSLCRLKVGKELFTRFGPDLVQELQVQGFDIFLDLKFHDIPTTVAKAVSAAADLGVWMVNVHASGGLRMMQAARESLEKYERPPILIAVTVLTSMESSELSDIGVEADAQSQVIRLASLAKQAGLQGVVCSGHELGAIKEHCGQDFLAITPGIRPAAAAQGDQRRVMTPAEALANGSDYLVIGRPITQAKDPLASLKSISLECQ